MSTSVIPKCVPIGLLQPLSIPTQIWKDVLMNFVIVLPNSFGFTVNMVILLHLKDITIVEL